MADQVPRRSPPPPRTAGPETTAAARGSDPRPPAGSCESPGRLIYEHGPLHSPCLSRADASGWAAPSAGRPARPDCGGRVGLGPAAAGLGPPNGSGMLWLQVQVGPLLDPAQRSAGLQLRRRCARLRVGQLARAREPRHGRPEPRAGFIIAGSSICLRGATVRRLSTVARRLRVEDAPARLERWLWRGPSESDEGGAGIAAAARASVQRPGFKSRRIAFAASASDRGH